MAFSSFEREEKKCFYSNNDTPFPNSLTEFTVSMWKQIRNQFYLITPDYPDYYIISSVKSPSILLRKLSQNHSHLNHTVMIIIKEIVYCII